jgi:preprotein translocase subunit SecY
MYGGTSTYLPLKVNQAGVIPVIFASSLIYIPRLITQLIHSGSGGVGNSWWDKLVGNYLSNPANPVYVSIYFGLIVFFTYFYVSVTFNPDERADEMKKFGGFIPGIRPGKPTADYLRYVLSRITLPGSIYLGLIASLPILVLSVGAGGAGNQLPFGGTAILIAIGVGLDTVKQIESQLMQRNYEGFLK